MNPSQTGVSIPLWGRFETQFQSTIAYREPVRDVKLTATFTGPSGQTRQVEGFWDGGNVWRIRFAPDEEGSWQYRTTCDHASDGGLHAQIGIVNCVGRLDTTPFDRHGPLRLAANRRYLVHADGTPFLWIGDTAWNGPLRATPTEWVHYLKERRRQKFNAVQWVTTQWLAASTGDRSGAKAFSGSDRIVINPLFFQRLDEQMTTTARAGFLNVPVLLWAAVWSTPEANGKNPGIFLPETEAILLARYMVARWSADPVVWILAGDGNYLGGNAERWKRIGRAVFDDPHHAPVSLHAAGMEWNGAEFRDEPWLDLLGYQSGHGDNQETLSWLVSGPPARDWSMEPARPVINLEPPYEDHIAHQSRKRIDSHFVRRALYWSVLVSPVAGVSYGAHGVWAWDDGTSLSEGHPDAGLPKPWREALLLAGAEEVRHLRSLLESMEWWRLVPAPELLRTQPGTVDKNRFIVAAKNRDNTVGVIYIPQDPFVELNIPAGLHGGSAEWFNPRTGLRQRVVRTNDNDDRFLTPSAGDWVLLLTCKGFVPLSPDS